MRTLFRLMVLLLAASALFACEQESIGISDINNPREEKLVPRYGETVSVTFVSDSPWTAELVLKQNEDQEWASISQVIGNDGPGKGTVRVRFTRNTQGDERSADLYVTSGDSDPVLVASFTQESGTGASTMSSYLNQYMHERLLKEYLWADEYAELEVDMNLSYDKFLYENLVQLGDVNIEDGGYYRDYSSSAGDRYIYSYISEITSTKAPVVTKAGELSSTYGLGIGPLFASLFESGTDYIGLTIGYVYPGSPAEDAGLRRGDTIYKIGPTRITNANYKQYMQELFYSPTGSYEIHYARYIPNDQEQRYNLDLNNVASVTAGTYGYNPILYAAILSDSESADAGSKTFNIGYMASESFDSSAQEVLDYQINQFINAGVTELILDLRFNVGGEVQQSRWLSSAIAGREYDDRIFFKAEYNDGKREDWKFLSGPSETDKLGRAPDMGLERLWVIMSENTASASELVIAGLRGVDFPVHLIGSRSEGKNVGMVVTQELYNGRRFEFAPITYRALNAKNEYGPKDGFEPDEGNMINNQNSSYGDDIDNMFPYSFGDWGNFDFNMALYFCFCDIVGDDRPSYDDGPSPLSVKSGVAGKRMHAHKIQNASRPEAVTVITPQVGRFGNVIYR